MKIFLLALLCASVQGSHEPASTRGPLPTIGKRTLDVQVTERWELRVVAADMRLEKSYYWDYGVADSSIRVEKGARFELEDTAISDARARAITRSYSEVNSKIDSSIEFTIPHCEERYRERGAVRGESDCSWSTLHYRWDIDQGEYEVTRELKAGSRKLPDPVPEADEGLRALVIDPVQAFAAAPIELQLLVRHWRASEPPVTRLIVDADSKAQAQQLTLALSAVIDALPRLEGLQGELTENARIRTDAVREYVLVLKTGTDADVSHQVVERMRVHPGSDDWIGMEIDTARMDATLRGSVRVTRGRGERVPSSVRMEGAVTLGLDLSGPYLLGGRAQLHYSLEGTLERELNTRTE